MSEQVLDSRTTILFSEANGLRINRKDMSVFESLEVIQRLLMHLRLRQGGLNVMSYVDSLNVFEDEPVEDMRVCIAWNPELELIQASVTGVSELGACQILELAVAYFHSYLLAPKE